MVTWKWGGRNGGQIGGQNEVEMDAPILQPNYTGAQAPQYT